MTGGLRDQFEDTLKVLSEKVWEGRCRSPDIDEWLSNFDGRHSGSVDQEHLYALHLLSSTSYFGLREMKVLLRTMFRDLFRYPIIQDIRRDLNGTTDVEAVDARFARELAATRFIGMGTPAESGTHLLYPFRQVNELGKNLFPNMHDLIAWAGKHSPSSRPRRIIIVDDLCGSGSQALRYGRDLLAALQPTITETPNPPQLHYLVLFGTVHGLEMVRNKGVFHAVNAVSILDGTYTTYGDDSRRIPGASRSHYS